MALRRERMRLGDMLIRQNVLTEDELKKALELQKGSGKKIGEVLVDNGFITEDMIVRALQMQLGLKVVQLTGVTIPKEVRNLVSVDILKKYTCIPFEQGYSNEYVNYPGYDERVKKAQKINDGAITQYPYVMGDEITIAQTHGQYYQLGLEQDRDINKNSDGKSDVVVWYTLTDGYYSISPKDVRNNYYFYSKGNVIYTGAGHASVSDNDEIQLFINAITAAANVTSVEPKASFIKSLNPNAAVETTKYYMTDQATWNNQDEVNVVNNKMDFYINVKDYNMVSADLNQADFDKQEITMQFYIEDDNGEVQSGSGTNKPLRDITRDIKNIKEYGGSDKGIDVSDDGMFHTKKSNAFGFYVQNIENYLHNSLNNDYKSSCKIYAKISSTVYLYNVPKKQTVWTSIELKQRQLFDLD